MESDPTLVDVGSSPPTGRVGLRAALVRGAAWTSGANAGASLLSAGVGLGLARVLGPADFGIQAAVVTVTAFFGAVVDTGFGSVVVQRDDLDQARLSSIFWSGLAASAVLYLGVVAATPLIARMFGSAALRLALPVAALNGFAFGAAIVPAALLRRRLAFASLARARISGAAIGAVVAVVTALAGGQYWALIGFSLASAVVTSSVICGMSGWVPSRTFRVDHVASVRGYATSMMSFFTVNYWGRNADDLLIGRFLGVGPLGFYSLAQRLVSMPLELLTGSLVPLLHPTFVAMGDDVPRQRAAYLELVRVTATATFTIAALVWLLADPVVRIALGPRWLPTADVMRALAPWVAIQPVNSLCGSVFMARNAAHIMLRCAILGAIAVVIGMAFGLRHGISGVAWGYTIGYLGVAAPVSTLMAFRLLDGRARNLGRALLKPALLAAAILVVGLAVEFATGASR